MITGMIRVRSVLFVCAITILLSSSAQAATITVDAGILVGAKNVIVNGSLYDVAFIEGTCVSVFGACDIVANFAFTTESDARAASQALFDQVFLDGPLGNFDSDLTKTYGCGHAVMEIDQCFALTPFGTLTHPVDGVAARLAMAVNTAHPVMADEILVGHAFTNYHSGADAEGVFAKWTPVAQSVPEHTSTLGLVGMGIAIMLTMRRAG